MYTYKNLITAYEKAGVKKDDVIYVTGNFGRPGVYEVQGKEALLQAHFNALIELLGPEGTIVVPTHSFYLCNTSDPFDINNTRSERGPFTEYVRKQSGSVRQYHPFASLTAYGGQAKDICGDTTRHAYGLHTPFFRLVERDAMFISVGQKIEKSIALVHHVEFMMGVPYRYTKEFVHPCIVEEEIRQELFYLYVLWRDCDIERDRNKKIIQYFKNSYEIKTTELGRSDIKSLSMKDFFNSTTELLKQDIYSWLDHPPENRPYRI